MRRKLPPESFDFYVGLGIGRSYSAVAEHYGASKGAVTALAKRENWQSRLAKLEAEARSKANEKAVETLEQVNDRDLRIARTLQAKALQALQNMSLDNPKDVIRALDVSFRQQRVILGEPSERSAVSIEDTIKREYERWMISKETVK